MKTTNLIFALLSTGAFVCWIFQPLLPISVTNAILFRMVMGFGIGVMYGSAMAKFLL